MTLREFRLPRYGEVLSVLILGCSSPSQEQAAKGSNSRVPPGTGATPYAQVEDNIRHDTLLIQTTFDMGDGTFVMVAGNVEETFEGLRLYRYRLLADSTAEILATSTPAYDSWTMLPSFFKIPPPGSHIVLANFGERESWGQKVLWMDGAFADLGFMDVALPERIHDVDTVLLKRRSIAPYARISQHSDTVLFTFDVDSLFVYDDLAGQNDIILPASEVRYTYHRETGLQLWISGQRRSAKASV